MNRSSSFLSLVFVACIFLFGCNKDVKVISTLELTDNVTTVDFGKIGGQQSIGVTSNTTWTVTVNTTATSWLTCLPLSGKGNGQLSVSATAFEGGTAPRTGTITIETQDGTISLPVTVTQSHFIAGITVTPTESTAPAAGSNVPITVNAPGPSAWSITSTLPAWIGRTDKVQEGITLVVAANPGDARNADITFALDAFPDLKQTIKVKQDPATISVAPLAGPVAIAGGDVPLTVTTTGGAAWSIVPSSLPDWITTKDKTQTGITLVIPANTGFQRRQTLTFALDAFPTITTTLEVVQDADVIVVAPGTTAAQLYTILQGIPVTPDTPPNKIVVLPGGEVFEFTTAGVPMNFKLITTDPAATEKATLRINAKDARLFAFANGAVYDEIKFQNLKLEGMETYNNYCLYPRTGEIFKQLNTLTFENCEISHFKAFFFTLSGALSGTPRIGTITVNNCQVYDCCNAGGTTAGAFFHAYNSSGYGGMDNIVITNSTFRYVWQSLINCQGNYESVKTVKIENCTFYDFLKNPNLTGAINVFIVNASANNTVAVSVKNVIFGSNTPFQGTITATTPRVAHVWAGSYDAATKLSKDKVYITTDHQMLNMGTSDYDITTDHTNLASDALWKDPANGDFHFITSGAWSTAGDPRWR